METIRRTPWTRAWAWCVMLAMSLSWLAGCETPSSAREIRLAGIVVDGRRLASDDEAAAMVGVWRDGQALAVRRGMRLQRGDQVVTAARTEAVIRFPGGTELYLGPSSSGRVGSWTEALGEMFAKVWGAFSIETEFVKAGVRGTAFSLRADPDGRTEVVVVNGSVELSSRAGAWAPVMLQAGGAAVAHPQAPRPRRAGEAELRQARDWAERMERLVPADTGGAGGGAAAAVALGAIAAILIGSSDDKPRSGDAPDVRPNAPGPLPAPTGLRPGAPQPEQAPTLVCGAPVSLGWNPVRGAQDYQVTLQAMPPRAQAWQTIATPVARGTSASVTVPAGARLRWWVHARDARGPGAAPLPMHFNCSSAR